MGITASTSPCHEHKPKSHEHWLRILLHLCLRHHGPVPIMRGGPFICTVTIHPRALVSCIFLACPLRLIYIYTYCMIALDCCCRTYRIQAYLHSFYSCLITTFYCFAPYLPHYSILFDIRREVYRCIVRLSSWYQILNLRSLSVVQRGARDFAQEVSKGVKRPIWMILFI
jgi:hypothetical protein